MENLTAIDRYSGTVFDKSIQGLSKSPAGQ